MDKQSEAIPLYEPIIASERRLLPRSADSRVGRVFARRPNGDFATALSDKIARLFQEILFNAYDEAFEGLIAIIESVESEARRLDSDSNN